jgi:hypothetical protein
VAEAAAEIVLVVKLVAQVVALVMLSAQELRVKDMLVDQHLLALKVAVAVVVQVQ